MTYLQPPNLHQTVTKKDYPAADKNRFVFYEDFIGSTDTYTWTSTGGGTVAKSAAAGGVLNITVVGRDITHTINFGGKFCVNGTDFDMTFRIAVSLGQTDVVPEFGLINATTTSKISFRYNATGPSWDLLTQSSLGTTTNNAGSTAINTSYHVFRAIRGLNSAGTSEVIFYIDGVAIASSTTNLPANIMQPFVTITNPNKNITSNIYVDLITFSGIR